MENDTAYFKNITIFVSGPRLSKKQSPVLCAFAIVISKDTKSHKGTGHGLRRSRGFVSFCADLRPWYKPLVEKLCFLTSRLFCQLACLAKFHVNAISCLAQEG